MNSHLPASLKILLTTWTDPTPGSWLQGKAARMGQGCPPADRGVLGGCSAEGRSNRRAIGAKGLRASGGTTRIHLGNQAEAAEQVFGQGDLLVLPGHGWSWDRGCICQLGVE